jgi:hypothetical protein
LQPDKCKFLRHKVKYLGHVISENGVKPDPKKIEAVSNFPRPRKPKNIKQFLGLAGYYRRFIPNFSKVAKPLTQLLKKDVAFKWMGNQEDAFNTLNDTYNRTHPAICGLFSTVQSHNRRIWIRRGRRIKSRTNRKRSTDCIRLEITKPRRTKLIHDRKRMSSDRLQHNAFPTVFIRKKIYYNNRP